MQLAGSTHAAGVRSAMLLCAFQAGSYPGRLKNTQTLSWKFTTLDGLVWKLFLRWKCFWKKVLFAHHIMLNCSVLSSPQSHPSVTQAKHKHTKTRRTGTKHEVQRTYSNRTILRKLIFTLLSNCGSCSRRITNINKLNVTWCQYWVIIKNTLKDPEKFNLMSSPLCHHLLQPKQKCQKFCDVRTKSRCQNYCLTLKRSIFRNGKSNHCWVFDQLWLWCKGIC